MDELLKLLKVIDPEDKVLNDVQKIEEIIIPGNYDAQREFAIKIVEEYNLRELIYLNNSPNEQIIRLGEFLNFKQTHHVIVKPFLLKYLDKFKLIPNALNAEIDRGYKSYPYMYSNIDTDFIYLEKFQKDSDGIELFEVYKRFFDMTVFIKTTPFTLPETKQKLIADFTTLATIFQNKISRHPYLQLSTTFYFRGRFGKKDSFLPEVSRTLKILEQYEIFEITKDLLKFAKGAPRELELFEVLQCWKYNVASSEEEDVRKAIISMFLATKTSLEDTSGEDATVPIPKQLIWEITQMPGYERFINKFEGL